MLAALYILCFLAAFAAVAKPMSLDPPIHTAARDFEPLQVLCKVNGFTLPAVVDTGAQVSVMTSSCAQRCRISPFIDTRFGGKAIGVGSDEVVGEIRDLEIEIGTATVSPRIAVLRGSNSRVDFIIGMDLLKRFRSEISLKDETLRLHTASRTYVVPFLTKAALAAKAAAAEKAAAAAQLDEEAELASTKSAVGPLSSDLTRARIADAVNQRHAALRRPQPVVEAAPASEAGSAASEAPAAAGAFDEGDGDDEGEDQEEEEEGVADSEAEMVSVAGF